MEKREHITVIIPYDEIIQTISHGVIGEILKATYVQKHESDKFLSRKQAAKVLGVSLVTLSNYSLKRGIIPCYRIGSRILFKKDEVESAVKLVTTLKGKRGEVGR